jgi:hypothetical protein
MTALKIHWDFRALWGVQGGLAKIYVLWLLAGAAYSLYSMIRMSIRIHSRASSTGSGEALALSNKISKRLQNLRQFHAFLLILFGVVCAFEVLLAERSLRYLDDIPTYGGTVVFEPVAAIALFVLTILLVLHVAQWGVLNYAESAREKK